MKNQISVRQLCVTGFAALLAPAAAAAGLDWRGALLAVPVVMLAVWLAAGAAGRDGGLLGGLSRGWRGVLALVYLGWGLLAAGTGLALCGQRLAASAGGGTFWLTVLAALPVLWLAAGKPEAFARAGEIFYLVMLAVMIAIVLLGAGQAEWKYLWKETGRIGTSFVTAAGVGCLGVYAVLLWNGKEKGETGRWVRWSCAGGLALAVMAALTVGSLSPALAGAVERPFFVMTVGLGQTARTEALAACLWLAADTAFAGLMLQSGRALWGEVCKSGGGKWTGAALTAAALGLALWEERRGAPEELVKGALAWGGLVLGAGVPGAVQLLGRKRGEGDK